MNRMPTRLLFVLAFAACSDDSSSGVVHDASNSDGVDQLTFTPPDTTTGFDTTVPTDTSGDSDDADAGPCPGCFGSPCDDNVDCNSQWCVPGPDGTICTQTCITECPDGFSCRPVTAGADVQFLCIYDNSSYCAPCDKDLDCVDPLSPGVQSRCVTDTDTSQGSFCRTPCDDDGDCPGSAVCRTTITDDVEVSLCRPPDGEVCTCSSWASGRQASTSCALTNSFGTCTGRRRCAADGLSACNARLAAAELCNGIDDDCDSVTDETFPDDGMACDSDDPDVCNDDVMRCINGSPLCVEVIGPPPVEVCNGIDDDCDGLTDEEDDDLVIPPCENQAGVCAGAAKPLALCQREAGWLACSEADYADP